METKNINIYIATHKEFNVPNKDGYVPIQVGAKMNEPLPYIKDDTGNNISEKNKNYCELTALYWIWKNKKEDIVGLTHYRRYLYNNIFSIKENNLLSCKKIEKILNRYDMILPKSLKMKNTIEEQYVHSHIVNDLRKCKPIIHEIYPEYEDDFEKVLKRKKMYAYNMFITKREYFEEYMEWLFNILSRLEKQIDISGYSEYNQRVYGFLAERLLNVWVEKNKLKIKECVVYNTQLSIREQVLQNIL